MNAVADAINALQVSRVRLLAERAEAVLPIDAEIAKVDSALLALGAEPVAPFDAAPAKPVGHVPAKRATRRAPRSETPGTGEPFAERERKRFADAHPPTKTANTTGPRPQPRRRGKATPEDITDACQAAFRDGKSMTAALVEQFGYTYRSAEQVISQLRKAGRPIPRADPKAAGQRAAEVAAGRAPHRTRITPAEPERALKFTVDQVRTAIEAKQ